MTTLPRSAPLLPLVFLAVTACGDGGNASSSRADAMAADPFCEAAMTRVDSFMASFDGGSTPRGAPSEGTAVVGYTTEILEGMDAFHTSDYFASQHQRFVNLMTLVRVDEALEPVPWLAESWDLSEDATRLTFHLRDDVFWHDGERTDAYDVAFTYLRATDPRTAFPNAAFFAHYVPGEEGVEVQDSLTVTFHLRPHAEILDPWRALAIMPEHLLGDVPPDRLAEHPFGSRCPVGNGPFVFVAHRADDRWVFEANPAFPEALGGRPALNRLVYRVIPDQTTLLTELLTGSVDVFVGLRPDQASMVLEDPGTDLRTLGARDFTFVGWNSRRPTLADPRVRRALTRAVDRHAVVDALLRGYGEVAHSGLPPFHWAFDPDMSGLDFDPVQARRLLDQAGWVDRDGDGVRENPDGVPLRLRAIFNASNQDRRTIAELMQAQLREVGVEFTPEPLEGGAVRARVADVENRDFDAIILSWTHEFRVDESDLFASDRVDDMFAFAGLRDPVVDSLLERLPMVVDREEGRVLWDRYQRRIIELQPFTYFYYSQRLVGVSNRMEGVDVDFRGEWVNVQHWRIRPGAR